MNAEKQARTAKLDTDREAWLRIAQGWMSLLRKRPQRDAEAFNDQSAAQGTGQKDSNEARSRQPKALSSHCPFQIFTAHGHWVTAETTILVPPCRPHPAAASAGPDRVAALELLASCDATAARKGS
jgi:hypothetical protein